MKNIYKIITGTILILLLSFTLSSALSASSFRRKKKKVPKSDLYYGKNWEKMDRALDRRIDGPNAEKRKKNRDKMKYKKRKKNG